MSRLSVIGGGNLCLRVILFGLALFALSGAADAAVSRTFESTALSARLITAQDGVPPGAATVSAGLQVELESGWKTYWRSPGEVGIPPAVDWAGSENVASVEFLWPAPTRFTAFGIENFGYEDEVVFPLQIALQRPGEPASLNAKVSLLVCSDICVPVDFDLSLGLSPGSGIDRTSGDLIAAALKRVPAAAEAAGVSGAIAHIDDNRTTLTIEMSAGDGLRNPDAFPELGPGTALGKPDIRLGDGGALLWAEFPILSVDEATLTDPVVTVTDGPGRAFTVVPQAVAGPPAPPFTLRAFAPAISDLLWIAAAAFLGGLILNVMPCVLPVLSIKLSSALKHQGSASATIRVGFLAAAAGVMVFMWALAAILYALQGVGVTVGWGLQFQNPVFLALMILVLAVFAANLFGAFEVALPAGIQTRLANSGAGKGHAADFLTGLFGAVMATPCSAPFLGTAVAFALAGRGVDIAIVFTALGLGLALPYLLVAAAPGLARALPRPGRWMVWLKIVLGGLLAGTAIWLVWVMTGVAGTSAAFTVVGLSAVLVLLLSLRGQAPVLRTTGAVAVLALTLAAPPYLADTSSRAPQGGEVIAWTAFDRGDIARRVSRGEVVFLDITADWCLTCKANKALVLEREPVLSALNAPDVTPMQADWTRPDERISRFL